MCDCGVEIENAEHYFILGKAELKLESL